LKQPISQRCELDAVCLNIDRRKESRRQTRKVHGFDLSPLLIDCRDYKRRFCPRKG